jgi:RNA polymerase sigma factor (sigma-70 family)
LATAVRTPREFTDDQLVAATRHGDDGAFEQLYGRYRGPITGYVQKMVKDHARAEDVTQEVFMSALRRMRETERPIAFKPWVYEIARNACIDQFRRSQRGEEVSYDATDGLPATDHLQLVTRDASPEDAFDTKQRLDHLCGAFGGLSGTHHQILVLRELEGLSYREIGERLGMSRPAVESTLFRARRRLTEEYDDLVSGRRCARVQSIMAEAAEGMLGARDRRRLARHLSYCQPCRRHARVLGVEATPTRSVAAKLAALIPFPAFLRRRDLAQADPTTRGPAGVQVSSTLAQWSANASAAAEPLAGWAKATLTAAAVALAGVGAGITAHNGVISQLTSGGGSRAHHSPARHAPHQGVAGAATATGIGVSGRHGTGQGSDASPPNPAAGQGAGARGDAANGAPGGSVGASVSRVGLPSGGAGTPGVPSLRDIHAPSVPSATDGPAPDRGSQVPPPRVDLNAPAVSTPSTPSAPSTPSDPSAPSVPSAPKSVPNVLG